ncbi:Glycosyltransferase involved in cell wall bisynthesis [Pseudomonas sp. ok272]|uniref:glycosyltransferase family 4 protein n=1 Tax=unclassified Pseudomonas TaxID=196821 RepID=UPI0008C4D03D|nr:MULTISPECIES: glycosyltransferase family 4 protein [unclassified Pseudomonas]SEM87053.1 Glycosyltransferase involved in cell wall bisynthesis [Pseudomonas sp. ok272]SFM76867.1 Glycosyltransferase involved in cell wall bisynthesis [Pseudomonas sp. ok602]
MKIMLLVEELGIGGLPNYVLDLARALNAQGDRTLVAHQGTQVPAHLDCAGVELLGLGDVPSPDHALARIQAWGPDLVHVHLCSDSDLLAALLDSGLALMRSFHDYTSMCLRRGRRRFSGDRCQRPLGWSCALNGCLIGPPQPGGRLPRLMDLAGKINERGMYQRFRAAVVGSQHMGRVLRINGFSDQRIHVVPYFSRFDQQAQQPQPGGKPALHGRPLQLLFAGQAVKGKGLEVLVRALGEVTGDWRLVALSSGPRLASAQALAEKLQLSARITFIDWLPPQELAKHYRAADLFVLPSVWDDPGPLVGIEAMAFETPVLAFAVGGIADYVRDGQTGLLVTDVSAKGLAAGVQRALDAPECLAPLGQAAREWVKHHHSRDGHLRALRQLYQQCADPVHAHPSLGLIPGSLNV